MINQSIRLLLTAVLLASPLALSAAEATSSESSATRFTRMDTDDAAKPRALQVAIVSYTKEGEVDGARVDLVSALHVGDTSYYAALNERFTTYDSLLYELIAPKGTVITPERESKSAISSVQRGMRSILDLSHQLEEVDYTAANFVHADLSPKEMYEKMGERGESLSTYFWRIMVASHRESKRDPLGMRAIFQLASALSSGKRNPMKIMLAHDFADIDRFSDMLGNDETSAIIGARNERAIEVLLAELEEGKRQLGIFYGAAHMRDMERRLLKLGFSVAETTWVDAWVL